jgi:hypothetical protein
MKSEEQTMINALLEKTVLVKNGLVKVLKALFNEPVISELQSVWLCVLITQFHNLEISFYVKCLFKLEVESQFDQTQP